MRILGPETSRMHQSRIDSGFYNKYMSGKGLDIGFSGGVKDAQPVLDSAIGIELGYPGYNGLHLPFPNESQDYVFSSHCLEHIKDWQTTLREWHRVTKINGYIVIIVPHQYLYERKYNLPSQWNSGGHLRFYTPGKLGMEIELSLEPNTYRVECIKDNADGYDYSIPLDKHPHGPYEIIGIIQKIKEPLWKLA